MSMYKFDWLYVLPTVRGILDCRVNSTFCDSYSLIFLSLCTSFMFFMQKTWKKHISTSIWCVQHLNAGQNIQQIEVEMLCYYSPIQRLLYYKAEVTTLNKSQWGSCKVRAQDVVTINRVYSKDF